MEVWWGLELQAARGWSGQTGERQHRRTKGQEEETREEEKKKRRVAGGWFVTRRREQDVDARSEFSQSGVRRRRSQNGTEEKRKKKKKEEGCGGNSCLHVHPSTSNGKTPAQALCEVICQAAGWPRTGVCNPALCFVWSALAWANEQRAASDGSVEVQMAWRTVPKVQVQQQ